MQGSKSPQVKPQSRREILELIAAAAVGALTPLACRTASITVAGWVEVHADPSSAAEIGMHWIRDQNPQPTADQLAAVLAAPLDVASLNAGGIEMIRRHLLEKHHADFAAGRVVRVAGWLLSNTETSVYALMAGLVREVR